VITGAAIARIGSRPLMTMERVGMGAGKRRWTDRPNVLRVFLGEHDGDTDEQIVVLEPTSTTDAQSRLATTHKQARSTPPRFGEAGRPVSCDGALCVERRCARANIY
jgi:hypothetical protein